MKTLLLTVLFTLIASYAHAQAGAAKTLIVRLDTAHAFGGSCSQEVVCFDALLNDVQIGVMIVDGQMSFVDRDVRTGEYNRIYLEKAHPCANSDSDPEGAREFHIDMDKGIWSDEQNAVNECRVDLVG